MRAERGREYLGHKAVRVIRVSTKGQEDKMSLIAQDKLGGDYARRVGLRVADEPFKIVESASKEMERKKFFAVIEFVKQHSIKHVIFDKVDRAVRGFRSAIIIEEMMENHGVKFHFARDNLVIDVDSQPQEKLRFYLSVILGKYYIDNLKSEIRKGVSARIDAGEWSWKAPIGYLNVRDKDSKRSVIRKDPAVADAIAEIFEKYSTGNYSLAELHQVLVRAGSPSRSWKVLEKVLSNPFYYGVMPVKGRVLPATHEPIVSKELFDACQKIRGIRAVQFAASEQKRAFVKPFMGLMRCAACKHQITGEVVQNGGGRFYIYYRCSFRGCANKKRVAQDDVLWHAILSRKSYVPLMESFNLC